MDVVGTCSSYGRAPCVRCVLLSFLQLTGDLGPRWALQVIVLGGGVAPSQVFGVDRRRYRKGPFSRETAQAKAWAECGGVLALTWVAPDGGRSGRSFLSSTRMPYVVAPVPGDSDWLS